MRLDVIKEYALAGGVCNGVLVIVFHLIFLAALVYGQIWLSEWSADPVDVDPVEQRKLRDLRLGVYGGVVGLQGVNVHVVERP